MAWAEAPASRKPSATATPHVLPPPRQSSTLHAHEQILSHQTVTLPESREWHYKCAPTGLLHNALSDPSRSGVDAQGIIDRLLRCFGTGRFAHVQRTPVRTAEGGGHALLTFQDSAKRGPARSLAALAQAASDHLHELIRDHGDEQMPVGANRLVVIDRA